MTLHPPSTAYREVVGRTPEERPKVPARAVVDEYLVLARAAIAEAEPWCQPASRSRESRDQKATRLIAEGCVIVLEVDPPVAVVHSSGNRYRVRLEDRWRCTCPNPAGTCSHVAAVRRITTMRRTP